MNTYEVVFKDGTDITIDADQYAIDPQSSHVFFLQYNAVHGIDDIVLWLNADTVKYIKTIPPNQKAAIIPVSQTFVSGKPISGSVPINPTATPADPFGRAMKGIGKP